MALDSGAFADWHRARRRRSAWEYSGWPRAYAEMLLDEKAGVSAAWNTVDNGRGPGAKANGYSHGPLCGIAVAGHRYS